MNKLENDMQDIIIFVVKNGLSVVYLCINFQLRIKGLM